MAETCEDQIDQMALNATKAETIEVVSPKAKLNTGSTKQVPDGRKEYLQKWLISLGEESPKEPDLEKVIELPDPDSDEEDLVDKNPFANNIEDFTVKDQDNEEGTTEERMLRFLERIELRAAFPKSCLRDNVFMVDRPRDAVKLGKKLPTLSMEDNCRAKELITISICEVYSPFQFWFHFVGTMYDICFLEDMNLRINQFYNNNTEDVSGYRMAEYFLKAGYICAAKHNTQWRRAKILVTPPKDADWVSIYYLDYASAAQVQPGDLRFLPEWFTEAPPLAARGTLSHIHPLGVHWSPDSTSQFRRLTRNAHLFAEVTELDEDEGVLFLRVSQTKSFDPTINQMLVAANLAGESNHYSQRTIDYNCGRRVRYLRERLPSFEMLESRLFPWDDEEFEWTFDDIIYSPSFYKEYQLPKLPNPFQAGLLEALAAWMPAYRKEQEKWIQIYRNASREEREAHNRSVLEKLEMAKDKEAEEPISGPKERQGDNDPEEQKNTYEDRAEHIEMDKNEEREEFSIVD
ncbi:uncharacterized protein LOC108095347 isoform X2 [Drosophila ficusphila]|nr:uncharacterized protein LOC108095347 isoform X2 [Drosophila ficusphila]